MRERIPKIILVGGDMAILSLSWFLSYWTRTKLVPLFGYQINPLASYIKALPIIIISWIGGGYLYGLYRRRKDITPLEEIQTFIKSVLLGAGIVMSIAFLFREFYLGRSVVLLFNIYTFFLLGIFRLIYHKVERELRKRGYGRRNVIIVGAGVTGARVLQKIQDNPEIGFNVIGFIDADPEKVGKKIGGVEVLGTPDKIEDLIKRYQIDEVVIALPSMPRDKVMEWVAEMENTGVRFRLVSEAFSVLSKESRVELVGDFPLLELGSGEVSPFYPVLKRAMDLLIASFLLILTIPLWVIIAIGIKLDSKGPVFFKQERVGYKGKRFVLYKFRTMFVHTPPFSESPKDENDPRITKFGRFLRRTSLDELPQLINVIKGEMSLVGPRPEMPFIVERYSKWERKRLDVKPGITGLWQILGRKNLPLQENIHYDFYYIKNRSIILDLMILLKTIPAVLKRKGAY
jgi:exopolysaccharide biosynthesis polyprenyl glycosylphosphotransferase